MKIRLRENMFSDREQLFLEDGELRAYLFRFESGDRKFMLLLLLLGGSCIAGRCLGYGTVEFYPRMDSIVNGAGDILFYLVFMAFMWLPGLMEWKEELLWRSYDLNL